MRHGLSELDLGIARTLIVFLLSGSQGSSGREDRRNGANAEIPPRPVICHSRSSLDRMIVLAFSPCRQ
jgi:hypothetical protein